MTTEQILRTSIPYHLAKLYESVQLESIARLRVILLVDLFEHVLRTLGLIGLAEYNQRGLSDSQVEDARSFLEKPSLGHWWSMVQALDKVLSTEEFPFMTPPLRQSYREGEFYSAAELLAPMAEIELPKKVRPVYFLDLLVQFRNKKIGHGSLTEAEAITVIESLEAALCEWIAGLKALQDRHLIFVRQVSWIKDHFVYDGMDLTAGVSIYPATLAGQDAIAHDRFYLEFKQGSPAASLIPLFPYFAFYRITNTIFVYNELSNKKHLILRCPYSSDSLTLDEDHVLVIGTGCKGPLAGADLSGDQEEKIPTPTVVSKEYSPMKIWYDIITPHEDIRKGEFDEAIFAADLGDVASGSAPQDYRDPYLFFKKTYPTIGLKNILSRVHQTLTTGKGSSVIQVQTPFGGGKTHVLVAIYHYLKHGNLIRELLPPGLEPLQANVSVIAGNHWNALTGIASDGLARRTFWGEVAYQIGGPDGYEEFRADDEARLSPGKEKLRSFLQSHQPFVLLFDEILEYVNRALDAQLDVKGKTGVSLGTQTFSFFQELTEAISTLSKGMIVVTLPSSYLEDYGDETEESLARLNKIFGRLESIETPVQGEEIYAIIRRRLFEVEGMKTTPMREIVLGYFQLYQQYHDDLPNKVRDAAYRDKMELAYPFHPEVIDILYEKWSTYSTFQRTRGVLRLLANVIEELYQREAPIDLILPGDLNLDRPSIRQEFLKHIGQEYEGVIASDIAGHESKSLLLDASNKPWKHMAQCIATSVFFHSFSAEDGTKGINLPYIKLAVLRSDTIPALATDVLGKLANNLWYLNSRGDAYYFSRIPNLNRMILDKKSLFESSYEDEMRQVIQKEIGNKFRAYLWPESGEGIPDNRELKLVFLRPEDSGVHIGEWTERRGNNFREFKNTLFFSLADSAGFGKLREDIKTHLALQDIKKEIQSGHSPLPPEKQEEVDRRIREITRDYSYNVRRMYHVLRYGDVNGGRTLDLGQPVTGKESLDSWFWRELTSSDVGAILTQLHYRTIVNKFMENNDQISLVVLLDQFYKNPELPALAEIGVLSRAVQLGVKDGAFGLIEIHDGQLVTESLKYQVDILIDLIQFEVDFYLLSHTRCEDILAHIVPTPPVEPGPIPGPEPGPQPRPTPIPGPTPPPTEKVYHRVRLVVADVPASKIADVNRGVLMPFSRAFGDFFFTIEIDVSSVDGISQTTLENQIKETIRQIGGRILEENKD